MCHIIRLFMAFGKLSEQFGAVVLKILSVFSNLAAFKMRRRGNRPPPILFYEFLLVHLETIGWLRKTLFQQVQWCLRLVRALAL